MTSEFRALMKYLNPKTFHVISPTEMAIFAKKMTFASFNNANHYRRLSFFCKELGPISNCSVEVLRTQKSKTAQDQQLAAPLTLELYYRLLMKSTHWNLDFGADRFGLQENTLFWSPMPFFWEVDPEFFSGVQKLYGGFYRGLPNDFDEGLKRMNLFPAKEVFLNSFGDQDQTQARFSLEEFQSALDRIFDVCLEKGIRLPADFLALGISMLTLYQNLGSSGQTFNMTELFKSLAISD